MVLQALKQSGEETAAELGIDNVGGIFVVLVGGIALAFIIAIAEFLWNVRKVAVTQHVSNSNLKIFKLLKIKQKLSDWNS